MSPTSKPRPYKASDQRHPGRGTDKVIDVAFREVEKKHTPLGYRVAQLSMVLAALFFGVVLFKFAKHEIEMYRFLNYMQQKYPPRPIPQH